MAEQRREYIVYDERAILGGTDEAAVLVSLGQSASPELAWEKAKRSMRDAGYSWVLYSYTTRRNIALKHDELIDERQERIYNYGEERTQRVSGRGVRSKRHNSRA